MSFFPPKSASESRPPRLRSAPTFVESVIQCTLDAQREEANIALPAQTDLFATVADAASAGNTLLACFGIDASRLPVHGNTDTHLLATLDTTLRDLPAEREALLDALLDSDQLIQAQVNLRNIRQEMSSFEAIEHETMLKLARNLLSQAGQLRANPGLRPWLDWAAVYTEQLDLERIPREARTDNHKQRLQELERYLSMGLLRAPMSALSPQPLLDKAALFPNFAEPLAFVAGQMALARLKGGKLSLPPMLMVGPPGTGKTLFGDMLAKCFGSRMHTLSMGAQSGGFSLAGLDRGWSNGRAGLVFDAIANGSSFAPVIMLDELDKAGNDSRSNPTGALYTLLEPHAARSFRDEYVALPMDASQVVWIATANDETQIPEALRSRFEVFHIEAPDAAGLEAIAREVYRTATQDMHGFPDDMPAQWLAQATHMSPRQLRLALQKALGRAALRASTTDSVNLHADDFVPAGKLTNTGHSMGFLRNEKRPT